VEISQLRYIRWQRGREDCRKILLVLSRAGVSRWRREREMKYSFCEEEAVETIRVTIWGRDCGIVNACLKHWNEFRWNE